MNFVGANGTQFPKITNIVGTTITVTPAISGTYSAGATVWTSSMDVASTLTFQYGSTLATANPISSNFAGGDFIVLSVSGSTLHMNQPPNTGLPTPGATQNITQMLWMDPKYGTLKFEMLGSPNVTVRKTSTFSQNEMFRFTYGSDVTIRGLEFWGKTVGYTPDPGIVAGDDGPRIFGCNNAHIEDCIFRNFGDSAIRTHTSSYWVGARGATYTNAGVYSNNVRVTGCYFLDCFQTSTTNSNSNYQGASRNVVYAYNTFENMGSSVKFANRAPGAANIYLIHNVFNLS